MIGWWVRFSDRYAVTPARLFLELSMKVRSYSPSRVDQMLARPRPNLSRMTGVTDQERLAAAEHRQRVHNVQTQLLLLFGDHRRLPALTGTRFCPLCLKEQQIWRPEWRDPLLVACPHHRVMLMDRCPACSQEPFSSIAWARRVRPATSCTEYLDKTPGPRKLRQSCQTDLSKLSPTPAPPELIRATQTFHDWMAGEQETRTCAGFPASPRAAARSLTLLACEALEAEGGDRTPPNTLEIADAIQKAQTILDQPSLAEAARAADSHGLLPVTGRLAPIGPATAIRSRPLDPVLHAIRLQSLHEHLPPTTQLTFRIGSDLPRTPLALRHRHTPRPLDYPQWTAPPAPFSAIPQLWWPSALPDFDLSCDERAQFSISIAVACVGRSITVANAAAQLGAPKAASARITSTWKRLAAHSGWPALRSTILTLADQLVQAPPPIDYADRRHKLASPGALELLITDDHSIRGMTDAERLWVWCHFTGGGPRWTPPEWGEARAPELSPCQPGRSVIQTISQAVKKLDSEPERWEPP